ncbi:hypothetical protein RchiOBHm_Chr5g0083991 [Rosa chinensis]|uniref:Uncharacterized protein n=1 Tax=Rosa chinensis TaxID=74649 RepID=A0A2P6QNQ0_ROSCH|nr:hypothetical protein RchiOBHm_Chr5g0083991 [Rosa chinensis]
MLLGLEPSRVSVIIALYKTSTNALSICDRSLCSLVSPLQPADMEFASYLSRWFSSFLVFV